MSLEGQNQNEGATRQEQVDRRRRRLATAAAASVPAFFVLRHRSVRAAETEGSVTASAMASRAPNVTDACRGCSPGLWASRPEHWPSGYDPGRRMARIKAGGTPFFGVFERAAHFNDVQDATALTMMDVLHLPTSQDPHRLGAYFVAALLNAAAGLTDPLPIERVQQMWRQWATSGSYVPPPGVDRWHAEDIKRYLETTWA